MFRFVRLSLNLLRALFIAPGDLIRFQKYALKEAKTLRDYLAIINRILPFAGRRWDVIYFPWNSAAINHRPLFDLGCPGVISCRGSQINIAPYNPERVSIREGLKETFAKAARVHFVSEAIKQEALQYESDPKKALVIRPAVNTDFFVPPLKEKKNPRLEIVSIGSPDWRKGFGYGLMAMRKALDSGVKLYYTMVGGNAVDIQRIQYTINDLNLQDDVHFKIKLSQDEIKKLLQQADIFCLPSVSEGISNGALEAMACGLPIVTTDAGGMREAVTDGVEGFVVPVRDPEAMAEKIQTLAKSPELRARMGRAARARVEKDFRLEEQIEKFSQLFKSVCDSSSQRL